MKEIQQSDIRTVIGRHVQSVSVILRGNSRFTVMNGALADIMVFGSRYQPSSSAVGIAYHKSMDTHITCTNSKAGMNNNTS